MYFQELPHSLCMNWTYKGQPCAVSKIGRQNGRIRAVYVQLFDGTPEFVHIGLEQNAFENRKNDDVA